MNFLLSNTFTTSLTRLTNDEQKAVKVTAFNLQMNPANPGMSFHKLDRARDKNFWSVRVNRDIRLIVHRTKESLLLCYVGHHDDAYDWAERRKVQRHPQTGAAQLVEIRERVEEVPVYSYKTVEEEKPLLFELVAEKELLGYGVPAEWIDDVRQANEDTLLDLADHLPDEAAEALLELATGGRPEPGLVAPAEADPFEHPDAQRRFRIMVDVEELQRALDYPWDKWTIFLHPAQRGMVEKEFNGPARVSGSAGTGKTIVALHRAVHLARLYPDTRVLLTTFSEILANALRHRLRRLISNQPGLGERLEVHAIVSVGRRLYESQFSEITFVTDKQRRTHLHEAQQEIEGASEIPLRFLIEEWTEVVDAWGIETWKEYRDVRRLGRKRRLPESRRATLWSVFERTRERLRGDGLLTESEMFTLLAESIAERKHPPYDIVVVDEAQDIGVAQLRFLAAVGGDRPNSLFFAGDLGQRIFQTPFSWKSLGVDIRGRSKTLRINYRTSHQIRSRADLLLGPEVSDVDGNIEDRRGTVSLFNGPDPTIHLYDSEADEIAGVVGWIRDRLIDGLAPHEIGIFVRSPAQLPRAERAATEASLPYHILDSRISTTTNEASLGTMHLAKGLEFRAVIVMACDDEVIPLQSRMESVTDASDLEEIYETERHLLYVACTRARDLLMVTGVGAGSEFFGDM